MPNILVGNADFKDTRNPGLAPLLSLLPGLGQIYNGQVRKGLLFLATTTSYLFVFILMAFNKNLIEGLTKFGQSVHMSPNAGLVSILSELHLGSTLSFIVIGLFIGFAICAMQDAYKHAIFLQRKYIYADYAMEINEAASGSYLLHFIGIIFLFILAVFFFKQSPPSHITYIEFVQNQLPTKKVVDSPYKSNHVSVSSGVHKPEPITPPSSKRGANSVAKVIQHPVADIPTPTFHPIMANNKTAVVPSPQQRVAVKSTLPVPHNITNTSAIVPHLLPQASNKSLGLPKPSLSKQDRGSQALILPKPSNSGSTSTGFINNGPAPVIGTNGNKFIPVPEKITGGSSGQNSASNNSGNIGPTKVASGLTPSVGIKPALGSSTMPTFGDPKGIAEDNARGNPLPNVNAHGVESLPSLPVSFDAYMEDLQRRIRRNWFPPKDPTSKHTVVVFKIHRHGELTDLHIERSSGLSTTDQAALNAVENAAPFRSLPPGSPENIDIQFTFDYNVFSGGSTIFKRF